MHRRTPKSFDRVGNNFFKKQGIMTFSIKTTPHIQTQAETPMSELFSAEKSLSVAIRKARRVARRNPHLEVWVSDGTQTVRVFNLDPHSTWGKNKDQSERWAKRVGEWRKFRDSHLEEGHGEWAPLPLGHTWCDMERFFGLS